MTEISRAALFGKLNPLAYRSVESATVFCKLRGNPYVELAHWLHQILATPDSDLHRIVRHFQLDPARLSTDLTEALDRLPRGATSIQDFSPLIEESIERAWIFATLMFGVNQVRTAHLLLGILSTTPLRNALLAMSREWARVKADDLSDAVPSALKDSPEAAQAASETGAQPGEASGAVAPAAMGKQEALAKFAVDLTQRARDGGIDPVTGRDAEIRQLVDVLMRRRQNNPILTGEAGVGKTAVVEGFALRIAQGDVPPPLQGVSLRVLDVGLLQAGASMKGEFENRLRQVIDEVQASPTPIILFIDEAHTLIGAGGAAGHGGRGQPAQARPGPRHPPDHRGHDLRRIQEVLREGPRADPPLPGRAGGRAGRGEGHRHDARHRWRAGEAPQGAASGRSHRGFGPAVPPLHPARQLPDKAVSLLDTAAARVAISQHAVPPAVEDTRRRIHLLETERGILAREAEVGITDETRMAGVQATLDEAAAQLNALEARWEAEKGLVERLLALRAQLRQAGQPVDAPVDAPVRAPVGAPVDGLMEAPAADGAVPDRAALLRELAGVQAELAAHQGETSADPPQRGPSGRRGRGRRLDRHPGRPHGPQRGGVGAEPGRHAGEARGGTGPRPANDRPQGADRPRRAGQPG